MILYAKPKSSHEPLSTVKCLFLLNLRHCDRLAGELLRLLGGIAEQLGFESASYFTVFFKSKTGRTPSQFQKKAR